MLPDGIDAWVIVGWTFGATVWLPGRVSVANLGVIGGNDTAV